MMLPLLYVPAPLQKGANIYHSVGCLFGSFYQSGVWRCHVFLMSSIEFLTLFLINGSPLPQGNRCRRITSTDCGIQIQRHLYRKAHTAES